MLFRSKRPSSFSEKDMEKGFSSPTGRDRNHISEQALDYYTLFTVINPMNTLLNDSIRPVLVNILMKTVEIN